MVLFTCFIVSQRKDGTTQFFPNSVNSANHMKSDLFNSDFGHLYMCS